LKDLEVECFVFNRLRGRMQRCGASQE